MGMRRGTLLFGVVGFWMSQAAAFDPASLGEVGLGLGSNPYWSHPVFANALWNGTGWLEFETNQFGSFVYFEGNPQFDALGYPKYLNPGRRLRALVYALHANESRPVGWPDRTTLARGKVVVTWQGDADVRANGGTYLAAESSGPATGRLVNGRRVYRFEGSDRLQWITVEDLNPSQPLTDLKVWLPDPADPDNAALENQLFHPTFLARLGDVPWVFLRFMDWMATNASPQRDWADRRLPRFVFQMGVLNRRAPAMGFVGDRKTGCAIEHMVALCNATGRDMWITVPHMATDDYVIKLARLLRYGSDGVEPYSSPQSNPVYPPLAAGRRVFVEYSNEIWSGGNSFPQGNWAQEQASALGITKAQFNARRSCQIWKIFYDVFAGQTQRLVRVAAVWTAHSGYTTEFLNEIAAYGPTLTPPQTADVVSPTTYFGNGIQDWAYQKARQQAGTMDPWFYTTEVYTNGAGQVRPVSVPHSDPYWSSTNVMRHVAETFREWKRRLLSGVKHAGGGPDATGLGGGFDWWLREAITNAFGGTKPIVAYEGGPSIYTDYMDSGDPRDAGITVFMELLNRQPQMADVYRIHLHQGKAKGLRTHGAFVDVSRWGRYGQWGHLEYLAQPPSNAVKWQVLMNWPVEMAGVRSIDAPLGTVPEFLTPAKLPVARWGEPYAQPITFTNATSLTVISELLSAGLAFSNQTISGVPMEPGDNYLFARLTDADGDPAWRTFYFKVVGGPGTILECNFEGTNLAASTPWTAHYVLKSNVTYSGWQRGAGIVPQAGTDGLIWSQNMPANESESTLALALTNQTHWSVVLTPAQLLDLRDAEVRFTIRRMDYHAPRRYAVLLNGAVVYDTGRFTDTEDREFVFRLEGGVYTNAVEIRLVGYAGQYAGHRTSLRAFKITAAHEAGYNSWIGTFPMLMGAASLPEADPDGDGVANLLEYAFDRNPTAAETGRLVEFAVTPQGGTNYLQMTYRRRKQAPDLVYVSQAGGELTNWSWSVSVVATSHYSAVLDEVVARVNKPLENVAVAHARLAVMRGALMKVADVYSVVRRVLVPGRNFLGPVGDPSTNTLSAVLPAGWFVGGATESGATVVDFWSQTAQVLTNRVWLSNLPHHPGWRESGTFADANQRLVDLQKGLIVTVRESHGVRTIFPGGYLPRPPQVQTIQNNGYSLISTRWPVPVDLGQSGLVASGFVGGHSQVSSDLAMLFNPHTQLFETKLWFDAGGQVWRDQTGAVTTQRLEPGTAALIRRRNRSGHFSWTNPLPYRSEQVWP
ncbi:MAG: hypothetical protein RMM51_10205 [Verrucomicrobiae bacterium]|nr:hypothetical protein [Verrucomicrobiae bacterium]